LGAGGRWFKSSRPDFGGFAAKIEQENSRSVEQKKEAEPSMATLATEPMVIRM
jgi:hypothetical protein